jgi:hypothetical protein
LKDDTDTVIFEHGIYTDEFIIGHDLIVGRDVLAGRDSKAVNDIIAGNDVTATANVVASTGHVQAATDVHADANVVADGKLFQGINAATPVYRVPSCLYTTTAIAATVGSTEKNLLSLVIKGGTLATDGDKLEMTAFGIAANNANGKNFKLYYGSTLIFDMMGDIGSYVARSTYRLGVTLYRSFAGGQTIEWQLMFGNNQQSGTNPLHWVSNTSTTEDESTDLTLRLTGTGVANDDIRNFGGHITWVPSN